MPTGTSPRPAYEQLEQQVCDLVAEDLRLPRTQVQPAARLVEDLHCDSLELVELILAIEDCFGVSLPDRVNDPVYKQVFTRPEFRVRDLAELIHLRWGTGRPVRGGLFRRQLAEPAVPPSDGFTQLGGRLADSEQAHLPLHEALVPNTHGSPTFRRRTDGMVCVQLP